MSVIDIDKIQGISDPIQIRLDGEVFTCDGFTKEILDKVTSLAEDSSPEDSPSFHAVCAKQLSVIFNQPEERFYKVEGRKLKAAVTLTMEALTQAGEAKGKRNVSKR
jgi:hypothetical protein